MMMYCIIAYGVKTVSLEISPEEWKKDFPRTFCALSLLIFMLSRSNQSVLVFIQIYTTDCMRAK